jgi:hypothetical protein
MTDEDLEDVGPAGGNPDATRSNPNFPDTDSGDDGGGSGGDSGGGGGGGDSTVPQAVRDAQDFFGGGGGTDTTDSGGGGSGVVDDVVSGAQDTVDEAVDRGQGAVDTVQDRVESGASADDSGSASDSQQSTDAATETDTTDPSDQPGGPPLGAAETVENVTGRDVDRDGDVGSEPDTSQQEQRARDSRQDQPGDRPAETGLEAESGRTGRAALNLEQRVIRENPAADDVGDVAVRREDGQLVAELTREGVRERAAEQSVLARGPQDIRVNEQGGETSVAFTDTALDRIERQQRRAEAVEQITGADPRDEVGVPDLIETRTVRSRSSPTRTQGSGGDDGLPAGVDEADLPGGVPGGRPNQQPSETIVDDVSGAGAIDDRADLGSPRQRTRAVDAGQRDFETSPTTTSPLVGMAISDDQAQAAVEGEREVARRAAQGDVGAQLAVVGRQLQQQGAGIREGTVDAFRDSPLPQGPEVGGGDATVGEQAASFAGGAVGFPLTLAGGGAQATGLAATGAADAEAADRLPDTLTEAGESQAEFATDRPVEATLIAGTAALGSPRVRSRARQAGRRAAETGRDIANPQTGRRLLADERGQLQRPSRSRSRSQSQQRSQQDLDTGVDPRIFERNRGRGGGRQSQGIDTPIGRRPGRRGIEGRQDFAQQVRDFRSLEETVPASDLRTVTEFDAPTTATGSAAAGAGDLLTQAQEQTVTAEDALDVTARQDTTTQGGPADAVTQGPQQRLQEAQEPTVSVDEVLRGEADGPLATDPGVGGTTERTRTQTDQQSDAILGESEAVQGSRVRGDEGRPGVGDEVGTEPRNRERTTPGEDQRPGDAVDTLPDQSVGVGQDGSQRIDDPNARANTRTPTLSVPNLGTPTTTDERPPNRDPPNTGPPRRPPGLPGIGIGTTPGVGVGGREPPQTGSEGDARLDPGFLNETLATIATGGTRPIDAPSQETLRSQPESQQLTGQLPTALEVSGDAEAQERLESVESIFSFGGGDLATGGDGDSGDDGFAFFDFGGDEDGNGGGLL